MSRNTNQAPKGVNRIWAAFVVAPAIRISANTFFTEDRSSLLADYVAGLIHRKLRGGLSNTYLGYNNLDVVSKNEEWLESTLGHCDNLPETFHESLFASNKMKSAGSHFPKKLSAREDLGNAFAVLFSNIDAVSPPTPKTEGPVLDFSTIAGRTRGATARPVPTQVPPPAEQIDEQVPYRVRTINLDVDVVTPIPEAPVPVDPQGPTWEDAEAQPDPEEVAHRTVGVTPAPATFDELVEALQQRTRRNEVTPAEMAETAAQTVQYRVIGNTIAGEILTGNPGDGFAAPPVMR